MKQGLISNRKMFQLSQCRETEKIINKVKFCFFLFPKNQSTSDKNLIMTKGTHCLSIVYKNYRF